MYKFSFGGETNIINLPEAIAYVSNTWASLHPAVMASYDKLMLNEAFWEYPTHNEFSRIANWHHLGNA